MMLRTRWRAGGREEHWGNGTPSCCCFESNEMSMKVGGSVRWGDQRKSRPEKRRRRAHARKRRRTPAPTQRRLLTLTKMRPRPPSTRSAQNAAKRPKNPTRPKRKRVLQTLFLLQLHPKPISKASKGDARARRRGLKKKKRKVSSEGFRCHSHAHQSVLKCSDFYMFHRIRMLLKPPPPFSARSQQPLASSTDSSATKSPFPSLLGITAFHASPCFLFFIDRLQPPTTR